MYARFPRTTQTAVIPIDWIEQAMGLESDPGPVRLGVDVAADGGDEFVIAQLHGQTVKIVHASRGNKSPVEVAGRVLEAIQRAQKIHEAQGTGEQVRVKIDAIGVGWGIAGLLDDWGKEGRHDADVVAVNVSQSAYDRDRFANQRAEMWWTGREALQPDEEGYQDLALDIDHATMMQLAAPSYRSNSSGRLQIESKADMTKRGIGSPDRAEAILLALFEPPRWEQVIAPPMGITKSNEWI